MTTFRGIGDPSVDGTRVASQDDLDAAVLLAEEARDDAEAAAASSEASAQDSAASLFEFNGIWLGSQGSDPTTDKNGDPLTGDELYHNTVSNDIRYYDLAFTIWRSFGIIGPGVSVDTNIAVWDGTGGNMLADSGQSIGSIGGGDVSGPASSTVDNLAVFADATGKTIKDGGPIGAGTGDVIGPSGAVDGNLAVFDGTTGKLLKDGGAPGGGGSAAANNLLINPDMQIWQEQTAGNISAQTPATDTFTADGWKIRQDGQGIDWGRVASHPVSGFSFGASASVTKTTDMIAFEQAIEATETAEFQIGTASAATVTLTFWVQASATGTFHAYIQNSARDRHYIAAFTINAASTWEQKTITLTLDTAGTWETAEGAIGLFLGINMAASTTTYQGTADVWAAGELYFAAGQTDLFAAANSFSMTRAKLEMGSAATGFAKPTFQEALAESMRRWQKSKPYEVAPDANINCCTGTGVDGAQTYRGTSAGGGFGGSVPLVVPMRATPTLYTYDPLNFLNSGTARFNASTVIGIAVQSVSANRFDVHAGTGGSVNVDWYFHWTVDARI